PGRAEGGGRPRTPRLHQRRLRRTLGLKKEPPQGSQMHPATARISSFVDQRGAIASLPTATEQKQRSETSQKRRSRFGNDLEINIAQITLIFRSADEKRSGQSPCQVRRSKTARHLTGHLIKDQTTPGRFIQTRIEQLVQSH